MTEGIEFTTSREALDAIKDMEVAGLKRSLTPWWAAIVMSVCGGTVFTLAGMEASRFYMAPFMLIMALAAIVGTRKYGAIAKFPRKSTLILIMAGLLTVLVPFVFVAREFRESYGLFAPLSLGVLVALVAFIVFMAERLWLFSKIIKAGAE